MAARMAVTWVVRLADCRHERVLIGFLRGPHPHPFQRRVQLRSPEPHGTADFEIRNQSGHARSRLERRVLGTPDSPPEHFSRLTHGLTHA